MPMRIRELIDDSSRFAFIFGLLFAVAAAVWAGTYWGWWAFMWDIALPVRIVGVVAISASVFVLWFGVITVMHLYLGFPSRIRSHRRMEVSVARSSQHFRYRRIAMITTCSW